MITRSRDVSLELKGVRKDLPDEIARNLEFFLLEFLTPGSVLKSSISAVRFSYDPYNLFLLPATRITTSRVSIYRDWKFSLIFLSRSTHRTISRNMKERSETDLSRSPGPIERVIRALSLEFARSKSPEIIRRICLHRSIDRPSG